MKRNGSLHIALRPVREDAQLQRVFAGVPAGAVLLCGMALTFRGVFPSAEMPWWTVLAAMAAFSAVLWLLQLTGKGRVADLCVLLAVLLFCVLFREKVSSGLCFLANDLGELWTEKTGRIFLELTAAEEKHLLWGAFPLFAVCAVLLHLSIQTEKAVFFLPVLLPIYGAVLTGFVPMGIGETLIGVGCILLLMQRSGASTGGQGLMGAPTWLASVLVCALLSAGIWAAFGNEEKQTDIDRVFHGLIYDEETNSMPEGKLKNLPAWQKSDTPALKVTMSEPQKLYLRGQIYETYDGSAWLPLSAEERAKQEALFYWLHDGGFYGQSQIGSAAVYTGNTVPAEMTVENLTACSAHGYLPYALCDGNAFFDPVLIGDTALPEMASMQYLPGSVPEWYGVQQALASAQNRSNITEYLRLEGAYEQYVTSVDLQLTNESWSVLERQIGEEEAPGTLSRIREFIRTFLSEALVYDEEVMTLSGSGDFLQYTLERSGCGYSVHYATAATLMLRYFGVPARYVEGYYISAEEAEVYGAGEEILLTEAHAHAWAEYYLPGVGFVPFEVTPGYIDDEELELGGIEEENRQIYSGEHLKYAQVEQPEPVDEPLQDRAAFALKPVYLFYVLLLLLFVLGGMILSRRFRLRKALKAIETAPNREAIAGCFGYAKRLLMTCPQIVPEDAAQAEALNREALFSCHEMSSLQRCRMEDYAARVLAECKKAWSVPQKLRYRLWDCLY